MYTEKDIFNLIAKTAYTVPELRSRLRLLRDYIDFRLFSGRSESETDVPTFLATHELSEGDVDAFSLWTEEFFAPFTRDEANNLLNQINERARGVPVVDLYIPFVPLRPDVVKWGEFLRANVDAFVFFELHTDPTLLGGCAFAWNGVYHNFSLRYYMLKKRIEIREILNKYVNGLW